MHDLRDFEHSLRYTEELEKYNAKGVEEVVLIIGDMTSLGTEQMRFAYEIRTRGTILEGADLIIEREAVEVICAKCGYEGLSRRSGAISASIRFRYCPAPDCGATSKWSKARAAGSRTSRFWRQRMYKYRRGDGQEDNR